MCQSADVILSSVFSILVNQAPGVQTHTYWKGGSHTETPTGHVSWLIVGTTAADWSVADLIYDK